MLTLEEYKLDIRQQQSLRDYALLLGLRIPEDNSDRDALITQDIDLFYDRLPKATNASWENPSTIRSNLLQSAVSKTRAQFVASLRSLPQIHISSYREEDKDKARKQKLFFQREEVINQFTEACEKIIVNILTYPFSVLFIGWQKKRVLHKNQYVRVEDGYIPLDDYVGIQGGYPPDPRAIFTAYEEEWEEDIKLEVPHPLDFYLYPSDSVSISKALATAERMRLLPEDLQRGITDEKFDKEAVQVTFDRLSHMWDETNEERISANADFALDNPNLLYEDKLIEAYRIYFKLPSHLYKEVPETLLFETLEAVVVPKAQTVLKLDVSPYNEFPYVAFHLLPNPNAFMGQSLIELLRPEQIQSTAFLQYLCDALEFNITPIIKVTQACFEQNKGEAGLQLEPGKLIRIREPGDYEPVVSPPIPQAPFEMLAYFDQKAQELYSAPGYGQMPAKQRRSAEVAAVQQAATGMFEMYLYYFYRTLEQVFEMMARRFATFLPTEGLPIGSGEFIQPTDFEGKFSYKAFDITASVDLNAKLNQAMLRKQVADAFNMQAMQAISNPILYSRLYASTQRLLEALGSSPADIEALIGPPPESKEFQEIMEKLQQQAMQQQAMQQQAMQQQGAAAPPPEIGGQQQEPEEMQQMNIPNIPNPFMG